LFIQLDNYFKKKIKKIKNFFIDLNGSDFKSEYFFFKLEKLLDPYDITYEFINSKIKKNSIFGESAFLVIGYTYLYLNYLKSVLRFIFFFKKSLFYERLKKFIYSVIFFFKFIYAMVFFFQKEKKAYTIFFDV